MVLLEFLIVVVLYFLPSIIAIVRRRKNVAAICAVNLLLGLTVLGWIVALSWATSWKIGGVALGLWIIVALPVAFTTGRMHGSSMMPTISDGDVLIVSKLTYRSRTPRRGDIVMCDTPLNPASVVVTRLIAEDGDMVRIADGRVYVNDIPSQDNYVPDQYRSHDNLATQAIPAGYYFAIGDHRMNGRGDR